MANPQDTPLAIPWRFRVRRILLLLVCGMILFGAIAFLEVGKWLVVEDSLTQSRAIAVLSGNMPLRAIEAAKLYRQGYAPPEMGAQGEPGRRPESDNGLLQTSVCE